MNQLYNSARENFLHGRLDWGADPIHLALLEGSYIFDGAHIVYPDISADVVVTSPINDRPSADGFADATTAQYSNFVHNAPIVYAVLFFEKTLSNFDDAELIAFYDTIVGFPFIPTGGLYLVSPDVNFGGYFRI